VAAAAAAAAEKGEERRMRGKKRREWAHGTGRADAGLSGRLTRGKKHDEDLVCYKQFGFDGLVFFF
jgi:hypothetical protein